MPCRTPLSHSCRRAGTALTVGALLLLAVPPAAADTGQPGPDAPRVVNPAPDLSVLLAKLSSPDFKQREQAAKQLLQSRAITGREILELARIKLRDAQEFGDARDNRVFRHKLPETEREFDAFYAVLEQKSGIAADIIYVLGELHVEEAIPFLVENRMFIDHRQTSKPYFYPYRYPCLGAMMALGLPAADALLSAIETSAKGSSSWDAMLLSRILGRRTASGFLKDRIDRLIREQRRPSPVIPGTVPIAVRIARLEAVRSVLEAHPREFSGRDEWLEDRALSRKERVRQETGIP